jgi:DNA invertase Pin-like site-specific DNA recombinase
VTIDRPALQQLLDDIAAGRVNALVVYKIDRLNCSLTDLPRSSRSWMPGARPSFR